MLKFGKKSNKVFVLPLKKEKQIRLYKFLLTLPGHFHVKPNNFCIQNYKLLTNNKPSNNIETILWKYLLTFHIYSKANSSFSNTRRICAFTGRTRSFYRDFQLGRMESRKAIGAGMFFGVTKSSW